MGLDDDQKYNPERIVKNNVVESSFQNATEEMGVEITFGGYFIEDSNVRANRTGDRTIMFNEKYIDMPRDELQRVGFHEVQHVRNLDESNGSETDQLWAFTFTNQFSDIHNRMLAFYENKLAVGSVFKLKMYKDVPRNYDEMSIHSDSYDNWDELLAHLKGYEIYLRQKEAGIETTTQPYEFIEAFKPEDLRLLDQDYRQQVVNDLGERLDYLKPKSGEISISEEDL